jgi:hypothetical protein
MPLIRGRYPATNPLYKLLGGLSLSAQGNITARSNLDFLGLGNLVDGAIAATGVCTSVAVPVEPGDIITNVTVLVGATAEGTGTHAFLALYSGIASPALLAQTADDTGAASLAASAAYTKALTTAVQITPTNAPKGFIYATIGVTATTIPTLACVPVAAAVHYQWFTGGPKFLAATHDSAVGATAPATMGAQTAFARAPLVFLT